MTSSGLGQQQSARVERAGLRLQIVPCCLADRSWPVHSCSAASASWGGRSSVGVKPIVCALHALLVGHRLHIHQLHRLFNTQASGDFCGQRLRVPWFGILCDMRLIAIDSVCIVKYLYMIGTSIYFGFVSPLSL